jgi:hypothetical protein
VKRLTKSNSGRIRSVFIGCGAAVVLTVAVLIALAWFRSWTPFLDDGPFHGELVAQCPTRSPDQQFPIWGEMQLEVFDPQSEADEPIVSLRTSAGEILWCITASADEGTEVATLRFHRYLELPFLHPRVRGLVEWTYGREAMWWYVASNGELLEYWYSW